MIKVVIFDMGGVVVKWESDIAYRYVAERFGLDFKEVKEKVRALADPMQKGEINEKEFWIKFLDSYNKPLPPDWKDLWQKKFRERAKLNKGVMEIVDTLKNNGYQLAVITNTIPSHNVWMKKMNWYNPFDILIISCRDGARKPELDIFELALKKLGLKAKECIFIDNKEEYVRGAERAGLHAIVFKNAEQLKKDLEKFGVKIE